MTLTIQPQLVSMALVFAIIMVILILCNKSLSKQEKDPLKQPSVACSAILSLVQYVDNMVLEMTSKKYTEKLAPYIGTIGLYILLSNYIGLIAFDSPTANWSCNLALALVTWIMIQFTDIRYSGIKSYIKSFFEPIFLFLPANIMSTLSPLLSMSLRLFGNIISGTVLMTLLYGLTSSISTSLFSWIPVIGTAIGDIDIVGMVVAAPLRAYFDIFTGFIQMYLFIMLTLVFTGTKIPEEERKKEHNEDAQSSSDKNLIQGGI